jgi:hypothetical protein
MHVIHSNNLTEVSHDLLNSSQEKYQIQWNSDVMSTTYNKQILKGSDDNV